MDDIEIVCKRISGSVVWQRKATHRECFFGVRSSGERHTSCFCIQINSRSKITRKHIVESLQYFNRVPTINLSLDKKENQEGEMWIMKHSEPTHAAFEVQIVKETKYSDIIQRVTNKEYSTKDGPSWQLHYLQSSKLEESWDPDFKSQFSHIYHLYISFHTGIIDDYSCAVMCNLYLDILDRILGSRRSIQDYSKFDAYDIDHKIEVRILHYKAALLNNTELKTTIFNEYKTIIRYDKSEYLFPLKERDNRNLKFRSSYRCLTESYTIDFVDLCNVKNVSIYTTIVSILNMILLTIARDNGYEEEALLMKVLHVVNAKWIFYSEGVDMLFSSGLHMIPYLQYTIVKQIILSDIWNQSNSIEENLASMLSKDMFFKQEAMRQLLMEERKTSDKQSSEEKRPISFYSLCNLGNMDLLIPENRNNFLTTWMDRVNTAHGCCFMQISFYTFRGRFHLCIDYSTENVSEVTVSSVLDKFVDVLDYFL